MLGAKSDNSRYAAFHVASFVEGCWVSDAASPDADLT